MYDFSPYVIDNTSFLQKVSSTKSEREKNILIQEATADQILAIVEICLNILDFNYILTKQQKRRLARYADYYRALARSSTEEAARRKLQEGRGVVLGALLAPVLTTIAEQFLSKLTE